MKNKLKRICGLVSVCIMAVAVLTSCDLKKRIEGATTISLTNQLIISKEPIRFKNSATYAAVLPQLGDFTITSGDIKDVLESKEASLIKGVRLKEIVVEHDPSDPKFAANSATFNSLRELKVTVTTGTVTTTAATLTTNTGGKATFKCGESDKGFDVYSYLFAGSSQNMRLTFTQSGLTTVDNVDIPVLVSIKGDIVFKFI